jgi:hypothetical protein
MGDTIIAKAPVAMIAGMFVAAMAYTYLQVAQVPYGLPDPDMPSYAEDHPLRWRVLWVTINFAGFVSAMSFIAIVLGRLWRPVDRT